jgi:hypothetical protein
LATIYLVISTSSRTDKGVPKVNIISLSMLYLVVSTITIAGNATVTKEAAKNATSLRQSGHTLDEKPVRKLSFFLLPLLISLTLIELLKESCCVGFSLTNTKA